MARTTRILLELDLTAPLPETPRAPLSQLSSRGQPRLLEAIHRLHRAATDDRVVGLIAQTGPTGMGLASIQEIREAVRAFARSGKPTIAWSESFGELTSAMPGYYLATGFSSIWLQPSGQVGIPGLMLAVPFLRGTLDKLGVEPDLSQREQYKNAADSLMRDTFSEAHREASAALVGAMADILVDGIARGRRIDAAQVRALMDSSPLSAERARHEGLVDHLGYRHQAYSGVDDTLLSAGVGNYDRLLLSRYHPRRSDEVQRKAASLVGRHSPGVALVSVRGTIRTGHSAPGPFGTDAASTSTATVLGRLADDESVGAVVLRVDSPGGSYVASDAIWEAVRTVRSSGRPVVASMGNVAASGGYYVSMGADHILATPTTVTGSIGVLAGKVVVNGLLDKVGISVQDVTVGTRATMASLRHPYDQDQRAALEQWLDEVYEDFVAKAADGRGMTTAELRAVAGGRVWTGTQAVAKGLVDELGGLAAAVRRARALAGLGRNATVKEVSGLSAWEALRGPRSADDPTLSLHHTTGWGAYAAIASHLGLPREGPLVCTLPTTVR